MKITKPTAFSKDLTRLVITLLDDDFFEYKKQVVSDNESGESKKDESGSESESNKCELEGDDEPERRWVEGGRREE